MRWPLVAIAFSLFLTLFVAAAQPSDSQSAGHHGPQTTFGHSDDDVASSNLTVTEAYDRALVLLRGIIDPVVLAHSTTSSSSSPPASSSSDRSEQHGVNSKSSSQSGTETSSRNSRHLSATRTKLSDLSPYFTFLTSWGPIGTMMRLSIRLQHIFAAYWQRCAELLQTLGIVHPDSAHSRQGGGPFYAKGSKHREGNAPISGNARQWAGERAAQLWPEWEMHEGQHVVHGPFLLDLSASDGSGSGEESNTLDLSHVVRRWISSTSMGRRRRAARRRQHERACANLQEALALLNYSAYPPASTAQRGSPDALWVLAQHHVLGTHGAEPRPWMAVPYLNEMVDVVSPGNASARNLLGWIEGSREIWNAWGAPEVPEAFPGQAQSLSLLHHTFAARQGDYGSMLSLAYRHHAGIGTPVDCDESLKWYSRAANSSWARYKDGPVGGLTPPYTHLRLSDLAGGAYGPGASAASTGWEAHRPAVQAALHSLPGSGLLSSQNKAAGAGGRGDPSSSRLGDLLEFYSYHASGGSISYMMRLARIYYLGSIYGISESAGRVERDYVRARELALRVARQVWPVDVAHLRMVGGKRVMGRAATGGANAGAQRVEEDLVLQPAEPATTIYAGAAAALLGRMYLRGEGVEIDYARAWYWFWRGIDAGDRDCYYGYGLMRSQGLAPDQQAALATTGKAQGKGRVADWKGAVDAWEKAIKAGGPNGHAEASAALGKLHFDTKDFPGAMRHFAHAVAWGSPFEGHFMLATANADLYRRALATLRATGGSPSGGAAAAEAFLGTDEGKRCSAAALHFKTAAERGDWESPVFHRGMRAWELGDRKRALLWWSMAAERGDEAAENNVAWILDRDKRAWKVPGLVEGLRRVGGRRSKGETSPERVGEEPATDRLGLIYWTRSAAQGNVDALVKMGDYYYHGVGLAPSRSEAAVAARASAEAAQDYNATSTSRSSSKSSPRPFASPSPSYEKAMACYAAAADRQVSALAYWNMGHLYEEGLGVPRRDFHLAKRYYDMALEINAEAYLPVMLSLVRLHIRAFFATVWSGEESAVQLFSTGGYTGYGVFAGAGGGAEGAGGGQGYTEAEEDLLRAARQEHQRNQAQREHQQQQQRARTPARGAHRGPDGFEEGADPHLPEGYNLREPRGGDEEGAPGDDGSQGVSDDEADAMIEGAMIVIGLSALAMLMYARQAAQARAEQERRDHWADGTLMLRFSVSRHIHNIKN
ncbi:hypothetical protein BDZ90DRAFT_134936 [Jaminaea rosea]|uniref:HCP-like protein n=1 Tax=Jaminaea rosea TaxID=1569628 RepID=A0A316V0H9_9BASI|nr:hypothetical protein BDZ90DRAFT_134936 [Jaminaea rosea]PWN28945.1 hypothetical protein BDZ90DRAFT_134936 [Jaminaea rosea]